MCYTAKMALDHYVAQTYLGQWCDRKTGRKLQAYRKSTGKQFACWPEAVCAKKNDDLNPYLTKRDALGQYRTLWEPFWNAAVEGFAEASLRATTSLRLRSVGPACWRRRRQAPTSAQKSLRRSFAA